MQPFPFAEGQTVMKQGDKGDFFYVCERGVFDVYVSGADGTQNKVHTYAVTDGNHPCFGELALMYAKPRAATVKCSTAGLLWGLDRAGFRTVQQHSAGHDATRVRGVALLSPLLRPTAGGAGPHGRRHLEAGTVIAAKGATADSFFIVLRGTAQIIDGAPPPEPRPPPPPPPRSPRWRAAAGDDDDDDEGGDGAGGGPVVIEDSGYFGERALLVGEKYTQSLLALTEVHCMRIGRESLETLLGAPLQSLLDGEASRRQADADRAMKELASQGLQNVALGDFKLLAAVGAVGSSGAGALIRAEHTTTRSVYTLRVESARCMR